MGHILRSFKTNNRYINKASNYQSLKHYLKEISTIQYPKYHDFEIDILTLYIIEHSFRRSKAHIQILLCRKLIIKFNQLLLLKLN